MTGACPEVVYLTGHNGADYDAEITYEALAAVLVEDTEPVEGDAYVDIDPRGNDAFRF